MYGTTNIKFTYLFPLTPSPPERRKSLSFVHDGLKIQLDVHGFYVFFIPLYIFSLYMLRVLCALETYTAKKKKEE
jgi:hypothetical protein